MIDALRPVPVSELRRAATAADEVVNARWTEALARGESAMPLLALLDDWTQFTERDVRSLLLEISGAQATIDREWDEQRPTDEGSAAAFYERTETLIPLLLWWHATNLGPARGAIAAADVIVAAGGRRVLDFGCGIGSTALVLAAAGLEPVIADVAETALNFAQWRLKQRGVEVDAINLMESGLADVSSESCDAAVSYDVFEHLVKPLNQLAELDRILRPGGIICFNQVYVPVEDKAQHFPQCGEVVRWLGDHGYRLAHVPSVCWVAQKAPLRVPAQLFQGLVIRVRIQAARRFEGRRDPLGRRVAFHVIRHALG